MKWLNDHNSVDSDVAGTVISVAASKGDQALFDRMRAELHKTQDRRQRNILIGGLRGFQDPEIIKQRMAIVLTDEFDIREVLGFAFSAGPKTQRMPFEFVKQNLDALLKRLPREVGEDFASFLPQSGAAFCNAADRKELADFFQPKVNQYAGGERVLAQTLERIDLCIASRDALGPSLSEFLKNY
jgi:alanyl aminopeptidase